MSKVLIIRHLPEELCFQDKEQLLRHFGAEKVWETRSKRNYIFAAFPSIDQAKSSLFRLHQLEIARRRLVVEYSFDNVPFSESKQDSEKHSAITKHIHEFLRSLNAWNPSVNFYQPPSVNIKYKYPEVDENILINMVYQLSKHKPFYIQTLHLMNKMSLDMPFEANEKAYQYFKDNFREFFLDEIAILKPESEVESELSSDENKHEKSKTPLIVKRKHTLPPLKKRPAAVLSTAKLPTAKKKNVNQEEVFESGQILEQKKISVLVNQDALQKQTESDVQVVGEIGKFQKEAAQEKVECPPKEEEQPTITRKELLQNRISYSDMKILPVFKNYHPGPPSMRLYIKNLAKTVTESDVRRIYRRYIENLSDEEIIGFDVRVMQEGRMKGQGFVTFPSVELAEKALTETNGFMLKEKPMVVQFARVANKKPLD